MDHTVSNLPPGSGDFPALTSAEDGNRFSDPGGCKAVLINDLEYGVKNWILKFADDAKIFGQIATDMDTVRLQKDFDFKLIK